MMKQKSRKRKFQHSPHVPVSPSSSEHPANPHFLRRQPKPKLTPVMRPLPVGPPPSMYLAVFRGCRR